MTEDPRRKQAGQAFLILGYVCVAALLFNIVVRLGWLPVRIPGLYGFGNRWAWVLGAAVCFAIAWYLERLGGGRRPT